jgi:hypothetical protein
VVTLKPEADGNSFVDEIKDEDDNLDERTPPQRNVKTRSMANTSNNPEGPYETPNILRTRPWASSVIPDDTEAEDSEMERIISKMRANRVMKVSSRDT